MTRSGIALSLAWRDLVYDRFFLLCNVAAMVGVLVPLLVLFGVKNGVTQALLNDLLKNPSVLQIDTLGNKSFTPDQVDQIATWPEVAFVVPRVRSGFDSVNMLRVGGATIVPATLTPSGPGDPNLPEGILLETGEIALSKMAAGRLGAAIGDRVDMVGQLDPGQRPGNLRVETVVVAIVPADRIDGTAVLAPFDLADAFEALYEGYAVPRYGLTKGLPEGKRVAAIEGVRLYARDLASVVPLETRLGTFLDVGTRGSSADIEALFSLSRNLTLVLAITAGLAALGLGAALITGFYADVIRKQIGLASLSMIGLTSLQLASIPVFQATLTAVLGLAVSFPVFWAGAGLIDAMFGAGLPGDEPLAFLRVSEAIALCAAVLILCGFAAGAAAWSAMRIDPARVLREGH